jgi:hypothetical protein
MFREVSLPQVGSSELKVTRPVSIVATRSISSSCFWFACLSDAFAPAPTQRLDEHHGIVMDWARWGLE